MPGTNVIAGAQPVEWVEETSFATEEADADYNWFGIATSWSVEQGVESESITYLPEYGASNKLDKRMNVAHREMYNGDITYHPQNFDLLQYWTGASGGVADDPTSLQIGEVNESVDPEEFRRLLGGVGEEISISGSEDETWEVSGSLTFADAEDWATDDYIDADSGDGTSGSHATEDTTEPLKWKDLSNVQYGGTALSGAVESLEISVSNDLAIVRDPDSSNSTLIDAIIPVDREITVDIDLTYEGFDMLSEVRSYQKKDLTFDLDTYSFTVSGVQFPELPYEYSPDDLVSDSISSDPASELTWA